MTYPWIILRTFWHRPCRFGLALASGFIDVRVVFEDRLELCYGFLALRIVIGVIYCGAVSKGFDENVGLVCELVCLVDLII